MTQPTRAEYDQVMIPCYKPADLVMTHGKKCRLYDSQNRSYLDFGGGIAVNSLGNAPKIVRKALKAQSAKLCHISNVFTNDATLKLAKRLTSLTGFDRVFFTNSGAESNEAALKLARRTAFDDYGEQKDEIISFTHSFHGRTFFTVCVGGQDKYSSGFGPRPGAITHLPFNDIGAFEKQISDRTCAVIFEPVQGEGGVLPVDPAFAKRVRELCDKHHALLILDEVQSGCARSGTFFAYEQIGIRPDIVTTAKGLAGGVPIGCVLTNDAVAKHFKPGTHGSTFGGNALACAVGNAVLKHISAPEFLEKVVKHGAFMKASLEALSKELHVFTEVRGMGLLIGCELIPQLRAQLGDIQKAALKAGLIILTAGGTTIRLCPPLIIKKREITEGVAILKSVLKGFLANLPKAEEPVKAVKTGSRKTRASAKEPAVKQVKPAAKTPQTRKAQPAKPAAAAPAKAVPAQAAKAEKPAARAATVSAKQPAAEQAKPAVKTPQVQSLKPAASRKPAPAQAVKTAAPAAVTPRVPAKKPAVEPVKSPAAPAAAGTAAAAVKAPQAEAAKEVKPAAPSAASAVPSKPVL